VNQKCSYQSYSSNCKLNHSEISRIYQDSFKSVGVLSGTLEGLSVILLETAHGFLGLFFKLVELLSVLLDFWEDEHVVHGGSSEG